MIAALSPNDSSKSAPLNVDEIQEKALAISKTKTEDEIIVLLGQSTPPHVLDFLKRISDETRKKLPYKEILLLPSPKVDEKDLKMGKKVFNSLKRVVWKCLCDPESEVYKMWFTDGLRSVLDKKFITGSILTAISGYRIGAYALAVYFTALIFKTGLDVFCDAYKPSSIMDVRGK